MGRLGLALGYIITGDKRLLNEYNNSFTAYPIRQSYQPPPSKEWLAIVKKLNASKPIGPSTKGSRENK